MVRPWGLQMPLTTAFLPPPPALPAPLLIGVGEETCWGACQKKGGGRGPCTPVSFLQWLLLAGQFIVMS